ncbi:MAG TPA: type I restriction enzyme HsdR N-terminal domain-containing protein [Balneolaceae bacterium]|nr:type I restriction enzyme HsdR N-terminal domain-containing protein [Balneolaceae bacterium]
MSITAGQFPQIVFKNNEKYLWNSIQKKVLKNRPEERVRLQVVEYLLESGWSKHRISSEEQISSSKEGGLRTDLICYTKKFDPYLLVECKSTAVNISEQTADQIALYNKQINADYLLMTNGLTDFWYEFKDNEPKLLVEIPQPFQLNQSNQRTFEFWSARGFAGKKAAAALRKWLTRILTAQFQNVDSLRYLTFEKKLYQLDLSHYYQILTFGETRLAVTLLATAFGGTRLIVIQNKNGENKAVLDINLDILFKKEAPNASIYHSEGRKNIDIKKELDWNEEEFKLNLFAQKVNIFL